MFLSLFFTIHACDRRTDGRTDGRRTDISVITTSERTIWKNTPTN